MNQSKAPFKQEIQVRFRESDAAGILFFANLFDLAHDCFEDFIVACGLPWDEWFKSQEFIVPIRHTCCDFFAPLLPGQKYQIQVTVSELKSSSFELKYAFMKGDKIHAELKMVHVFVNKSTGQKMDIPARIQPALKAHHV